MNAIFFKTILFFSILFSQTKSEDLNMTLVTSTLINTSFNTTTITFSSGTVSEKLTQIQKQNLECIYVNGISKEAFDLCYGPNYSKFTDIFSNMEADYENELISNFQRDLNEVCPESKEPCAEMLRFLGQELASDLNIIEDLTAFCEIQKNLMDVNSAEMDKALDNLSKKYVIFLNIRIMLYKTMIDTISLVQKYISTTHIETNFDYQSFSAENAQKSLGLKKNSFVSGNPFETTSDLKRIEKHTGFAIGHVQGKVVRNLKKKKPEIERKIQDLSLQIQILTNPLTSRKLISDRSLDRNTFLRNLVPEAQNQKILTYYIANGLVDSSSLDFSQLPSVIVDQIKKNKLTLLKQSPTVLG